MADGNGLQKIGTSFDRAVAVLQRGGVVGIPTETYYGLAVNPNNLSAVEKVFRMKCRQLDKPLLLLIENINQLYGVVTHIPQAYNHLIAKYWPGPLTLVFPARSELCGLVTGPLKTVGVRISPHPIACQLVQKMGAPITATSANVSGYPAAREAGEVAEIFGDKVDYILDGGRCDGGACSTIVGMEKERLVVYRAGMIDIGE